MQEGLKIEYTFKVSENVYEGFQNTFEDKNILHVNAEYAKGKGFTDKVMYGNILNGFVSYFVGELLPDKEILIQKQEISFHKPVYMGDEVNFEANLSEIYESVGSYIFKFKFNNESGLLAKGKVQISKI